MNTFKHQFCYFSSKISKKIAGTAEIENQELRRQLSHYFETLKQRNEDLARIYDEQPEALLKVLDRF